MKNEPVWDQHRSLECIAVKPSRTHSSLFVQICKYFVPSIYLELELPQESHSGFNNIHPTVTIT